MKRGEVWTLQDRQYASKARPVVIIQSDRQMGQGMYLYPTYHDRGFITGRMRK